MRITGLDVEGFGVWSGLSIDELSDGLTVFFGPNEAGKTTLMQFVRTVFYGFSVERRERYVPPIHDGRPGGSLYVSGPRGDFQIKRWLQDECDAADLGDVDVLAADGTVQGRHLLAGLLADIDEPTFNNLFAFGLRELQELGTLNDTEAARRLYELTGGLDRISLAEVTGELASSRERILAAGDQPSQATQLLSERDRLLDDIGQLQEREGRRWSRLSAERHQWHEEVSRLQQRIDQMRAQGRVIGLAINVREKWHRRARLNDQLDALGQSPSVPPGSLERLDELNAQIAKRREHSQHLNRKRSKLRKQAAGLPIRQSLWRRAVQIDALGEHQQWIAALESRLQQSEAEVAELDEAIQSEHDQVGLERPDGADGLPELSSRSLTPLRRPARALRAACQSLRQAKRDVKAHCDEAHEYDGQIEAALVPIGESDLVVALEKAGNLVSQFRRRLQLDQRLDQLTRHRTDLQEQARQSLDRQVLSGWMLISLGGLFVLGVMLILTGLLGGLFLSITGPAGWSLALLGLGGTAAAALIKVLLERAAVRQLEACNGQVDLLGLQIEETKQQRDQLDGQLPRGGGPLVSRLHGAEAQLERLEQLLPLDAKRRATHQDVEAARHRAAQARGEVKTAQSRWRAALPDLGLPKTLSPKQVRQLAGRCEQIADLYRRRQRCAHVVDQHRRELATLADRVAALAADVGVELDSPRPGETLRQLLAEKSEQEKLIRRRDAIRQRAGSLRRRHVKISRGLDRLRRRRWTVIIAAGASDEQQFRQRALQHARVEMLRNERDQLSREISVVLADEPSEEIVADQLLAPDGQRLERRLDDLNGRQRASQSKLEKLCEQSGRITQQLKTLAEDRGLSALQVELGCVEQRLKEALHAWRVLAVTSLLLDTIRHVYETERQPETLGEASVFLNHLTDGQYTRIWTPLGENVLRVDDAGGNALPVEVLSRGTREQVFLSLRLALVAWYGRQGVRFPLVLDDVLVNFDARRAKAAAVVLRDFANEGHQLLVFTCHEHIMKIFKAMKIEIRALPSHTEPAEQATNAEAPKPRRRRRKRKETVTDTPADDYEQDVDQERQDARDEPDEWQDPKTLADAA